MILQEIRAKYPQYRKIDDKTLADAVYTKFYAGKVTREEFDRQSGVEDANTGILRTGVDQYVQGGTLGFGDEIQDLAVSSILSGVYNMTGKADDPAFNFSNLYNDARRISERDITSQQEEHPILSTAAQLAGGVAVGAGGAQKGSTALSRVANQSLGKRAVAGGVTGAGYGGGYGFGSGFGTEDRLERGALGAVVGAGAGAAVPVAGEIAKRGLSKVDDLRSKRTSLPGKTAAEREVAKHYSQRPDLDDIATNARTAIDDSRKSGIPLTSAEALNDEGLMRELGTLREDPKVMGAVQKFFNVREEKLVPKALDDMQQGIAPVTVDEANEAVVKAAQDVKEKLVTKAREQAKPLYDAAYQVKNVVSKPIDKILKTPAGKKALAHARDKMQNDMTLLAVPDKELGAIAKDLAAVGKMKAPGQVASGLKLRTLDYVKRAFDDMIETSKSAGNKDDARIVTNLKNKLLSELDAVSPEYQQARKIYSDSMGEMDEILKGRFGRLMNLTEMQQEKAVSEVFRGTTGQTKKMVSQLPKDATRKAGSGELARVIEGNKNSALTVPNKIGFQSTKVQEQWKSVLGEQYPQFESMMKTLQRAAKGTKAALGSPTQNKMAAEKRLMDSATETASDLALGNRIGAIIKLRDFVKKAVTRGADEKYILDKADLLMSERGVKLIEEVAAAMKKHGSGSDQVARKLIDVEKYLSIPATEAAIAVQ